MGLGRPQSGGHAAGGDGSCHGPQEATQTIDFRAHRTMPAQLTAAGSWADSGVRAETDSGCGDDVSVARRPPSLTPRQRISAVGRPGRILRRINSGRRRWVTRTVTGPAGDATVRAA